MIAVLLLLTACVSSGVTLVGTKRFDPLAENAKVTVFSKEADVGQAFDVLGIVNYENPGKYQSLTLDDAMPELKNLARSAGANALIIDHYETVASGIVSRGINVQARAIRLR